MSEEDIDVHNREVYSNGHIGSVTAGGGLCGSIKKKEFYTVIGKTNNITCIKVLFRKGNTTDYGYIDPSPGFTMKDYDWADSQEPYHLWYGKEDDTLTLAQDYGPYGKVHVLRTKAICCDKMGYNLQMVPDIQKYY